MTDQRQLIVVGATGFTGRLVAAALRAHGYDPTLAGRSEDELRAMVDELELSRSPVIVDLSDPKPFLSTLPDDSIVVNCVGPFGLFSTELIRQLVARRLRYVDVCGEQQFVQDSFTELHEIARRNRATLLHSCAFESFLADLMAHELLSGESGEIEELASYYWFDRILTSPGTRLTMRLVDHWRTVILRDGELVDKGPGEPIDVSDLDLAGRPLALFAPYPEVLFYEKSFAPRNAGSYMLLTEGEARLFGRPESGKKIPIEEILAQHERRPVRKPSPQSRARQGCGVVVVATRLDGRRQSLSFSGRDPYGLTAEIVAWVVGRLLEMNDIPSGVLPPGEVFAPSASFFRDLATWADFFEALEWRP